MLIDTSRWIEREGEAQTGILLTVSIKDKTETLGISYRKLEAEVKVDGEK